MKIALIGYGRMGHEIERVALEAGHEIAATFDPSAPDATHREVMAEGLERADVCVDFSHADGVLANLRTACAAGKPSVIGTTAWEKDLSEARRVVEALGGGMIHAPNFAIGVQTMFHVVAECARALDRLADFDVAVMESHHRGKADSPSGTAKRLANILLEEVTAKDTLLTDTPQRAPLANELHVVAQRIGAEPGSHTVTFDLGDEVLRISHASRSRAVFARGAVKAAEWIVGRTGVHEFRDLLFGRDD
jgi:4-hydroxy-tetrahydrodipicolinate reductase